MHDSWVIFPEQARRFYAGGDVRGRSTARRKWVRWPPHPSGDPIHMLPSAPSHLGLFAGVILAAGCGSSSSSSGDSGTTENGACSITWSGAVSAMQSCTALSDGSYNAGTDLSAFAISYTPPPASPTVAGLNVAIYFPGRPVPGTSFSSSDSGARGSVSVSQSGNPWLATVGDGTPTAGSYDLTVSAVNVIGAAADGTAYTLHGTLKAILPAREGTSATGTVMLDVVF